MQTSIVEVWRILIIILQNVLRCCALRAAHITSHNTIFLKDKEIIINLLLFARQKWKIVRIASVSNSEKSIVNLNPKPSGTCLIKCNFKTQKGQTYKRFIVECIEISTSWCVMAVVRNQSSRGGLKGYPHKLFLEI